MTPRIFRQKGCKTWRARFTVNGRKHDIALKTRLKEVADKRAREKYREMELEAAGLAPSKSIREAAETPLSELLQEYAADLKALNRSVTTIRRAKNRTPRIFEECCWKYLRDITPESFRSWRSVQNLKAKTLNDCLGDIRAFLNSLVCEGRIAANPLTSVKTIDLRGSDSSGRRAISDEESQRLLATAPCYRSLVYRTGLFTGLRHSELKALTWGDLHLDDDNPRFRTRAAVSKNRREVVLPLHSGLAAMLKEFRPQDAAAGDKVFAKGVPQMRRFNKDLKEAGIISEDSTGRYLGYHSFRKTFATWLNRAGVSPRVAMELMRHSDMRLTLQTYTESTMLPMGEELEKVPFFKSSPISSLNSGNQGPNLSKDGKSTSAVDSAETPETEEEGVEMTPIVPLWQKEKMADRERFELSVPFPVHTLSRRAH